MSLCSVLAFKYQHQKPHRHASLQTSGLLKPPEFNHMSGDLSPGVIVRDIIQDTGSQGKKSLPSTSICDNYDCIYSVNVTFTFQVNLKLAMARYRNVSVLH